MSLGFQNGVKPQTDVREGTGIITLLMFHNFLDRVSKMYKDSIEKRMNLGFEALQDEVASATTFRRYVN